MTPLLMICFPRSGGTLLARVLGTAENVIMASEINTAIGATPDHQAALPEVALKQQMAKWYGIDLAASSLEGVVTELIEHCGRQGREFVFRDWTYIDYYPNRWNGGHPTYQMTTFNFLDRILSLNTFALVRDAIDVFLSFSRDLEEFSRHYLIYVQSLERLKIPIIRYEDLAEDADAVFARFRREFGMTLPIEVESYTRNSRVTGDIQQSKTSRGILANRIERLPRKWVPSYVRRQINACSRIRRANEILGYPLCYESCRIEPFSDLAYRKLRNRVIRAAERLSWR